jgi:hypothetical protein
MELVIVAVVVAAAGTVFFRRTARNVRRALRPPAPGASCSGCTTSCSPEPPQRLVQLGNQKRDT